MPDRPPAGAPPPISDATVVVRRTAGGPLLPGAVLGHTYTIEALLSRGGTGEVYRARHVELGTIHAIKVIAPSLANNPDLIHRLAEQARKLGRVRNDVVVGYEGLFRGDGNMRYLVMEFVEGEPLTRILDRRRLEPDEVLRLRDRLADGLAAAHESGVIHHELSPDNIILPDGSVDRARLVSFAIEKTGSRGDATLIRTGPAKEFAFMSPEQMGLFGGHIDARSDIYSLGLVLAAAAVGFGKGLDMGANPATAIAARQRAPDLSPLPASLRPTIAPMLQPRPEDRPGSMRELLGGSKPPRRGDKPPRSRSLVKFLTIGAAAMVVVAAAISAVTIWRPGSAQPTTDLRAQLAAATAGYKCAAIDYDVAADRSVRVSGHASAPQDIERLRRTVSDIRGVGRISFEVGLMAWPYCEISTVLTPLRSGPGQEAPVMGLAAKELHTGDRLRAEVRAPAFDGYVYVDYFSDTEVVHLLPTTQDRFNLKPSRNHFAVGCPLSTAIALRGTPGMRALALIAVSRPLFPGLRVGVEPIRDYLDSLSGAIGRLQAAKTGAAMVLFDLRDAAGNPTPEIPCPSR